MGLIRTILALIILVILAHVALFYLGYGAATNDVVGAIYGLAELAEVPATLLLDVLPLSSEQRGFVDENTFYVTALTAAGVYAILFMLLGVGKD